MFWLQSLILISLVGLLVEAHVPPVAVVPIEDVDCGICLKRIWSGFNETEIVPACQHSFHSECILEWVQRWARTTCPICRGDIGANLRGLMEDSKRGVISRGWIITSICLIWFCMLMLFIQSRNSTASGGHHHDTTASSLQFPSSGFLFAAGTMVLFWFLLLAAETGIFHRQVVDAFIELFHR